MVYGTIVAQAQRIDVEGDRIVFRCAADQTMLGDRRDAREGLARGTGHGPGRPPDVGGGRRRQGRAAARRRVRRRGAAGQAAAGPRPEGGRP
ncbi:MAG: hypothetical protein MZV63_23860 [Marinilabiliales bacterium]|nr:hypothetical protein [Marinilabiliales bacterium]